MRRMFASATSFNSGISKWDVSSVADMDDMFSYADLFNSDISKWDVSSVKKMYGMFFHAVSFNGDISKWDVSSVKDMAHMFSFATSCNGDISKWDVSNVAHMDNMFRDAASFNRKLCGAAWVHSIASERNMFAGSCGSMSLTTCAFSPRSKEKLKSAVEACLKQSPEGDCSNGPHGPIGEWEVSRVTDMSFLFSNAVAFNGDISKWDVSGVTNMVSCSVLRVCLTAISRSGMCQASLT